MAHVRILDSYCWERAEGKFVERQQSKNRERGSTVKIGLLLVAQRFKKENINMEMYKVLKEKKKKKAREAGQELVGNHQAFR